MDENNFVRVAVYESESKAILAQSILEEAELDVQVAGLEPTALGSMIGEEPIEVFVRQPDLATAQQLLLTLDIAEDEIPAWTCQCGEEVDEGFGVCWSCGADYQAE